jgi:hypothetical protein
VSSSSSSSSCVIIIIIIIITHHQASLAVPSGDKELGVADGGLQL